MRDSNNPAFLAFVFAQMLFPRDYFHLFFAQVWDLRKNDVLYKMRGHTDTVTGFRLSPDGSFLLSNAMDNTGTLYNTNWGLPEFYAAEYSNTLSAEFCPD